MVGRRSFPFGMVKIQGLLSVVGRVCVFVLRFCRFFAMGGGDMFT